MADPSALTEGQLALLRRIRSTVLRTMALDPSADRASLVRLGLISGRPMKVGHRKTYSLTPAGYDTLGADDGA